MLLITIFSISRLHTLMCSTDSDSPEEEQETPKAEATTPRARKGQIQDSHVRSDRLVTVQIITELLGVLTRNLGF